MKTHVHGLDDLRYQSPFVTIDEMQFDNCILQASIEDGHDGEVDED